MRSITLSLATIHLELLAERAVYLPGQRILYIADLHLGKAAAFRRAGLAVPEGDTNDTLARCSALINRYTPAGLVLLGDILHTRLSADPTLAATIRRWRAQHAAVPMVAIQGNHDRELDRLDDVFDCQTEGIEAHGLQLFHHPPETAQSTPWLAGHWHPVVALEGAGDRMRLPSFIATTNQGLILPAFGSLTGGLVVKPKRGQTRFVSSGEQVYALSD
ncbi:MAG: ligase-associated DNA damage response endonuclease PdeM [Spiribacter sp.]|jgi:Predicted ICC-like phosphoesterases|nr:ligase-associated DNA damage response endonuclease PdeM [Spiribacter sp.]MDR9480334.1 ligase-associated DNA damage response endonuclease PdeM [Spiribacter sp.]